MNKRKEKKRPVWLEVTFDDLLQIVATAICPSVEIYVTRSSSLDRIWTEQLQNFFSEIFAEKFQILIKILLGSFPTSKVHF